MELILRQDVDKLGDAGSVVKVADGYARNYLLPKGLAMVVTDGSLKVIEKELEAKKRREVTLVKEMEVFAAEIASKSYTIKRKVGEEDKIFGSVTNADISDIIKEEGFEIDKKKILLEENIHALGAYSIKIKIHKEVEAEIKLWVVKE